jgi:hypothetical protein
VSKQTKYTRSARGQDCQVRLEGICNFNPETTVLAHLNGGGAGMKHLDIHGAFCCSSCHDAVDRRTHKDMEPDFLKLALHEGVVRTQAINFRAGLIKV